MARHLLFLLGSTALIAACAPTEPPKFVRAQPAEPPKLEVLIEPDTVPAFQQTLKPLPAEGDDEPDVQGLEAIEPAHADARIRRIARVTSVSLRGGPSCFRLFSRKP